MLNINMKCSEIHFECPERLDMCCQFCEMNYSPCESKCSGCWDVDQMTNAEMLDSTSIIEGISSKIETELTIPVA